MTLYHFSENPNITRFTPHVPRSNSEHRAAVWAIDPEHAPLYWFPRDCPRAAVWGLTGECGTSGPRLHVIELAWLLRLSTATIYRYHLPDEAFRPWAEAEGQFIASEPVEPIEVEAFTDLLALHVGAGIELRFVVNLWPMIDWIAGSGLPYSIIRKHLARPRI